MARSKRSNQFCSRRKTGNAQSRGGYERQEPSQFSAPMAATSAPRHQDYFSQHKTITDEHKNSGFTMADVARGTFLHNYPLWSERSRLRNKPVHFVSHGRSKLLRSDSSDESDVNSFSTMIAGCAAQHKVHAKEKIRPQELPTLDHTTSNGDKSRQMTILSPPIEPLINQNSCTDDLFIIDTIGEKTISQSRQTPEVELRESCSSPDNSSADEVILFRGRKLIAEISHRTSLPTVTSTRSQRSIDSFCPPPKMPQPPTSKKKKLRLEKTEQGRGPLDNEDVLLDYICNIRENDELGDLYRQSEHIGHDLGGSDEEYCFGSSQSGDETHGGSCVAGQVGRQHSIKNGSVTDLFHTYHDQENENDDLNNSADEQDILATSVAKSNDPSDWNALKTKSDMSQEQVEFDVMDWNRPSVQRVQRNKKARAKFISFSDCDSDLERQLQVAWKNDRHRKKERKQQREELRALGLLQKTAAHDLRLNYPFGMTIKQVADELRLFLQQEKEMYVAFSNDLLVVLVQMQANPVNNASITFPPMDLHARKIVHELADTFNIKSKSVGKAEQRRPSLYRTVRTTPYSQAIFDRAVGQVHRKFLPRADTKGKGKPSSRMQNRLGASITATSYQEGEIVGAAAPELGIGNRGRTMLEKMGWSCGTALGAEDNKGILQPVSLAMKRSKAGLG